MLQRKTVLVLGAGASKCLGYPVGIELTDQIISLLDGRRQLANQYGLMNDGGARLKEFIDTFDRSEMYSIDAFLARRPKYAEIGKMSIAAILLSNESQKVLYKSDNPDHWYRYLFNTIAHEQWEKLDFSNLKIISFNYDRCLESYLLLALSAAYDVTEADVVEKLKTLKIVHVYGSLGPTLPGDDEYFYYGSGNPINNAAIATRTLKVIPEGRDNDPSLLEAQAILNDAEAIAFLGFGFDEINLRRLDAAQSCSNSTNRTARPVVATCYGMTTTEAIRAAGRSAHPGLPLGFGKLPPGFHNKTCLETLRETLILG